MKNKRERDTYTRKEPCGILCSRRSTNIATTWSCTTCCTTWIKRHTRRSEKTSWGTSCGSSNSAAGHRCRWPRRRSRRWTGSRWCLAPRVASSWKPRDRRRRISLPVPPIAGRCSAARRTRCRSATRSHRAAARRIISTSSSSNNSNINRNSRSNNSKPRAAKAPSAPRAR